MACSAANVGIVAFGEGKAEIVQRALEVQSLPGALPAQLVRYLPFRLCSVALRVIASAA